MEHETYYIDTGNDRVYFNIIDGTVVCLGKTTNISTNKLADFLAIGRELGFKTGKL